MSELRVNPAEVHRSGVEIGDIAASVHSAFTDGDTAIAAAQSGWVGESAGALAAVAAEWQQVTRTQYANLVEHADKFIAAAQRYGSTDTSSADSLRGSADSIGEV